MSNVNETYLDVFRSLDFHRIKDHPNILIAANFWDAERYQAAKAAYKSCIPETPNKPSVKNIS